MKAVRVSPAAAAALTDILEYSIERWGPDRAEQYKKKLLDRVRAVARGEPPHPRPCEILMKGRRSAAGLCYCAVGSHFIVLRETDSLVEIVEFVHQGRNLERLVDLIT